MIRLLFVLLAYFQVSGRSFGQAEGLLRKAEWQVNLNNFNSAESCLHQALRANDFSLRDTQLVLTALRLETLIEMKKKAEQRKFLDTLAAKTAWLETMLRSYHRPFDSTRFCASYHRLSGLIEENEELKDETSAEWKRWKDFNKSAGYALLNHAPKWEYRIEPGKYAGELHIKNTENKINIFYDLLKNGDVEFSEVLFKTDAVIRSSEFKTAGYFGFSDGTGFVAVTEEKDIEGLSLIDVNSLDRFGEYISQAGTQLRLRLIIFFANQTPFAQGWKELDDNILGSASPAHHTGSINNNNIKFSQKKGMCSVYFIIHKHFQGPPASYEFHNHLYQNPEQYLEQFGVRLH